MDTAAMELLTCMTSHKVKMHWPTVQAAGALGQTQAANLTAEPFQDRSVVYNYEGWSADPKIDNWYTQAMAATDPSVILQILEQENEYIAQQHFSISLAFEVNYL